MTNSTHWRPLMALAACALAGELAVAQGPDSARKPMFAWSATGIHVWHNSARAYPEPSGVVWQGRGLTLAATAGVEGAFGPFSYSVRPIGFWTENRAYRPLDNVANTPGEFGIPWHRVEIDFPYRFGYGDYGRIDAGESFLRFDTRLFSAGFSNAAQSWGPARLQPLALSGNGGGFPHAFVGTGRPWNVLVGKVAMRWMAGQLAASPYAREHEFTSVRALIGAMATFSPFGLDGLEVGGLRLFQQRQSTVAYDWRSLTLPFAALLKNRVIDDYDPRREANQMASAFARVAPPGAPIELYGEFFRDDHNVNARDLAGEPDHDSAVLLGLHWTSGVDTLGKSITIENINSRFSHLARNREQETPYLHTRLLEGHSVNGLPIGSLLALGGGGLQVKVRRFRGNSSWMVDAMMARTAQDAQGGSYAGQMTGFYSIGVRRGKVVNGTNYEAGMRYQPSFGHLMRTNVQVSFSATRGYLRER